jgi:hypothetical protein
MLKAVDRLFKRLSATYGAAWDRSLGQTPVNDAKTAWAHELSNFKGSLHRVAWALENLPERCPNPIEFKHLCRAAPAAEVEALPESKADPARMAAELAKLGNVMAAKEASPHGMKDWAHRLKERHAAGHKLNAYQVVCYQAALKDFA